MDKTKGSGIKDSTMSFWQVRGYARRNLRTKNHLGKADHYMNFCGSLNFTTIPFAVFQSEKIKYRLP